MIPNQRHLFDIPGDVAYFNCGYMSPLMTKVRDAGRVGIDRKYHPWELSPPDFFSESERARDLFAGLIGAEAGDIAIVPAASYGVGVAAANLPLQPGQRIVLLADQFPSNVYPWRELAAEHGGEVVTVSRPGSGDWAEAILAVLDERVAVVALPHVHWTDGSLIDLERVGERARQVDAALVLDLTQSLGALPFDVKTVQPDFMVCATYKWLLGPYSLGFLYAAPKYHGGRPLEHGWITREDSEDFSALLNYKDGFQPGARRFDMGERANFALMPMAITALEQILEWTPAAIQATLASLNHDVAERASSLGLTSAPAEKRAGHFLGLRFPGGIPDGLAARLAEEKIFVSVRGDSMRVTPHLFNTSGDVDRLMSVLETL
jgi:selenocysteine lyase/cysteine desulfurase